MNIKRHTAQSTVFKPFLLLLLTALLLSNQPTPVVASSAAPRINLKDIYLNLRSISSVHLTVKQTLPHSSLTVNYDAVYLPDIPVVHIKETIDVGTTGQLPVNPTEFVGTGFGEWFGDVGDTLAKAGNSGPVRMGADRLFQSAITQIMLPLQDGGFAQLSKADMRVDGVTCDEYKWKSRVGQQTICLMPDRLLPVSMLTEMEDATYEDHFDKYNDPTNVFKLPPEAGSNLFYDAFIVLHRLKNFTYKIELLFQSGKAKPKLETTIQGTYVQTNWASKASEWAGTDTSKTPIKRYLQIGRQRWTAGGSEKSAYVKVAPFDPSGQVATNDKFHRTQPFLVWIAMANDPQFRTPIEKTGTTTFQGKAATEYMLTGVKGGIIKLVTLDDSNIPVHAEFSFTEPSTGRRDTIIWDIVSMDTADTSISAPTK